MISDLTPQIIDAEGTIEAADDQDAYSDAQSSLGSDTTSVNSSVLDYQYENGRRYHNFRAGKYSLPNDEHEQERLDLFHHVWGLVLKGQLHSAPLEGPKKALDIGTGTGIWAIDFADMYPDCEVTGVDLSPIQPGWVPPNVKFEVDDIEDDWTYDKNSFDYIHMRMLNGGIKKWERLLERCYEALKPGGYLEFVDGFSSAWTSEDGSYKPNGNWAKYVDLVAKGSGAFGVIQKPGSEMATLFSDAGFEEVVYTKHKMPVGPWPKNKKQKEIGKWGLAVVEPSVEAYGLAIFTRALGMSDKEAREVMSKAVSDLHDPKIHMIFPLDVVYGRKPLNE